MIDCEKCGLPNKDDSLYCEHCGARLSTKACRRCKTYVPPKASYCPRCGYPTQGAVCDKCGKINPDDSAFCSGCGNKLGGTVQTQAAATYDSEQTVAVPKEKKAMGGKAMYAYRIARSFTVSALLMCMFIFSFFGMFTVDTVTGVDFNSSLNIELETTDATVTGFDAVRGMFLLISPPTVKELKKDFSDFAKKNGYANSNGSIVDKEKAIREFGFFKMNIYEGNVSTNLVMYVLMYGLHSLALMVLSLVFFILSLVRAIKLTVKKTDEFGHDVLPLALITALSFGFIVTGGMLAAGTILNIVLGCMGLGGITACKYAIEKTPRASVLSNVRRGVCALLAVLIMCFAGSSLISVGYAKSYRDDGQQVEVYPDFNGKIPVDELIAGMDDPFAGDSIYSEILSEFASLIKSNDRITAVELDMFASVICLDEMSDYINDYDRAMLLRLLGSPTALCYSQEAVRSYEPGIKAVSWLMYFELLLLAAMSIVFLFKLFLEEAEPEKKRKTTLWSVLTMVGTLAMLVSPIAMIIMASSISKSLELGFTYGIGALPIVSAVLGVCAFVVDLVLRKCDKKKA